MLRGEPSILPPCLLVYLHVSCSPNALKEVIWAITGKYIGEHYRGIPGLDYGSCVCVCVCQDDVEVRPPLWNMPTHDSNAGVHSCLAFAGCL